MLDIGMSELKKATENFMTIQRIFFVVCGAIRTPFIDYRCDNETLHAAGMVGLGPSHQKCHSSDLRRVSQKITRSEGGRGGILMIVGSEIVSIDQLFGLESHDER